MDEGGGGELGTGAVGELDGEGALRVAAAGGGIGDGTGGPFNTPRRERRAGVFFSLPATNPSPRLVSLPNQRSHFKNPAFATQYHRHVHIQHHSTGTSPAPAPRSELIFRTGTRSA